MRRRTLIRLIPVTLAAPMVRAQGLEKPKVTLAVGEHMGGGVADALQLGHLLALFEGFAFFGHIKGWRP